MSAQPTPGSPPALPFDGNARHSVPAPRPSAPTPRPRPGIPDAPTARELAARRAYLERRRAARARMFRRRRRTAAGLLTLVLAGGGYAIAQSRSAATPAEPETTTIEPGAGSSVAAEGIRRRLPEPWESLANLAASAATITATSAPPAANPAAAAPAPAAPKPAPAPVVFELPGVTPLPKPANPDAAPAIDAALISAFRQAQAQAASQGVTLTLASGSRSWNDQQRLHDRALAKQGGDEIKASQWVLPPRYSLHVRGQAIDVSPGEAWLESNGSQWGLCRRYVNEAWHFELLTTPGVACPAPTPDAAG